MYNSAKCYFFFRPGSLVVEYTVEMPNKICDGTARTDCIANVKNSVETVSKQKKNVQTGALNGNLDETRTEFIGLCIMSQLYFFLHFKFD